MYEILMMQKDCSEMAALKFHNNHDYYMETFWAKCAAEYERRAKEVLLQDAN